MIINIILGIITMLLGIRIFGRDWKNFKENRDLDYITFNGFASAFLLILFGVFLVVGILDYRLLIDIVGDIFR